MLIAVLTLPDHAQRPCCQAQDRLWQRYGLVSARALPPLIALCLLDTRKAFSWTSAGSLLKALHDTVLTPFTIAAPTRLAGACAAAVQPAGVLQPLRNSLLDAVTGRRIQHPPYPPDSPPRPFEPFPYWGGNCSISTDTVFLACSEGCDLPEMPLGTEPLWPNPVRTAMLAVLEIATRLEEGHRLEVAWRVLAERKITAAG
ncbi:MAG: hypothetical protein EA384_06100 [Spirochaetaceae bacterium]|nr:MAG: hypothetical protein EA384_06100 [Spirochaetaceae bacterium]